MATFEVCWKMYGTAEVRADSMEEAVSIAAKELIGWNGFGTDLLKVCPSTDRMWSHDRPGRSISTPLSRICISGRTVRGSRQRDGTRI